MIKQAVPRILEHHHDYNIESLTAVATDLLPMLPKKMIEVLLYGMTETARYTAVVAHQKEVLKDLPEDKALMVQYAKSLASWVWGLRPVPMVTESAKGMNLPVIASTEPQKLATEAQTERLPEETAKSLENASLTIFVLTPIVQRLMPVWKMTQIDLEKVGSITENTQMIGSTPLRDERNSIAVEPINVEKPP